MPDPASASPLATALAPTQPTSIARSAESVTVALANAARVEVEARFLMARTNPRDFDRVRDTLLAHCARPRFAESARYARPVGGSCRICGGSGKPAGARCESCLGTGQAYAHGFAIRFVEAAVAAMGNLSTACYVIHEDDRTIRLRCEAVDLETNASWRDDVDVAKVIERSSPRAGQRIVGERLTSEGRRVYLVEPNADELAVKVAAVRSKELRTLALRLIPADLLEEAEDAIRTTLKRDDDQRTPADVVAKLVAAFDRVGVSRAALEEYLGKATDKIERSEVDGLRQIGAAVRDGVTTWSAIMAERRGDVERGQAAAGPTLADKVRERAAGGRRKGKPEASTPPAESKAEVEPKPVEAPAVDPVQAADQGREPGSDG